MPLPDTPYTRAKAGFKLLQYMAAGCAVIASPWGSTRWLVEESGAGLLASTPAQWELAIVSSRPTPSAERAWGRKVSGSCGVRRREAYADALRPCSAASPRARDRRSGASGR